MVYTTAQSQPNKPSKNLGMACNQRVNSRSAAHETRWAYDMESLQVRFCRHDGRIVAPQHAVFDAPVVVPPNFGPQQKRGTVEVVEQDAAGLSGAVGTSSWLCKIPKRGQVRTHAGESQGLLLLVVFFSKIKRLIQLDFSGDWRALARGSQQFLIMPLAGFGNIQHSRAIHVDGAAILRALIIALGHSLRRIVALPKKLEQIAERDSAPIPNNSHNLRVRCAPAAYFFVRGIFGVPSCIPNRSREHAGQAPKTLFRSPKAATAKKGFLLRSLQGRMQRVL